MTTCDRNRHAQPTDLPSRFAHVRSLIPRACSSTEGLALRADSSRGGTVAVRDPLPIQFSQLTEHEDDQPDRHRQPHSVDAAERDPR